MKKLLLGVVAAIGLACGVAYALQGTPTPLVAPETGENSLSQAEVFNMARIKPGMCTVSITISGAAGSGTCNGASGIITLAAATAGASGTNPSVVTLTNNKIQTTDIVLCGVDQNGVTSGAVLTCSAHITAANTVALSVLDGSSTAMTSSAMKLFFVVLTSGNPN